MIKLELTHDEAELLHKVLDCYLGELAIEMAANGIEDFTGILQKEDKSVQTMLRHLKEQGIGILTEDQVGEYE
ncbi:MAG: hypothetical protein HZB31_11355 [Nitrospirae bacterium]|nr:hypothetical protein [Nitrospirota bacterium]